MDKNEFSRARFLLGKTQTQMAELLRSSAKAVQSYEQGWRSIPAHVERQVLFLLVMKQGKKAPNSMLGCSKNVLWKSGAIVQPGI